MLIERKRTADLIPADYNPRKDLKPGDPEYDKLKFREEMGPGCHERCAGIAAQLEPMLKDLPGVRFLDANLLPRAGCSPVDGMHLTPEAHKAVAEALKNALTGVTLL